MTGEVIKSFLVGLGFGVDEGDLARFNKAINSATLKVTALYTSINAAVAGIVYGISKISQDFEAMGYEMHLIAPAINRAIILRQELFKAYSAAGTNLVEAAQASVRLNISMEKTKVVLKAIYNSVGAKFFPLLQKQSDAFRLKLYQNMPKIQNALERMVKFVFKAFEAVTELGLRLWSILTRVYDFFVKLDKATDGWSTVILAVIAAWKLLNLSFLATPFGMIVAGLVAILALYDDFQTWKEGGKSFFDWSAAVPIIDAVTKGLGYLADAWRGVVDVVGNVILAFYQLFHSDYQGFFESMKESARSLVNILKPLWDLLVQIGGGINTLGAAAANGIKSFFGGEGANVVSNIQKNPLKEQQQMQALGVNTSIAGMGTNQNVTQQTNITVNGAADASAVGKTVGSEQSRVNFDMARNLKGATR